MAAKRAPVTYAQAGVSIARGDSVVEHLKKSLPGIGGFGGLFPLPVKGYRAPVLVASTDGVGTKLLVADAAGRHDTVGIDLVAMSVNDLIVCGAKPLFFLDYIASSRLQMGQMKQILNGIIEGCAQAECTLLGGETAEMPGLYPDCLYDLAGFAVGVVDKSKALKPESVRVGDRLIGIASTGLHSNGYSLARKIVFDRAKLKAKDRIAELGETVGEALLRPTRIYVRTIMRLLKKHKIRSMAHITGGGIPGNLNRAIAKDTDAIVQESAWPKPPVFDWLAELGPVRKEEMLKTFNMGLGMILVVPAKEAPGVLRTLKGMKEKAWDVGKIVKGTGKAIVE